MTADLTTRVRSGHLVDLVAVARFLAGEDLPLAAAERQVVIHAMTRDGIPPTTIAKRLHENRRTVLPCLTQPPPRDRMGRDVVDVALTLSHDWSPRR